ncbi:MAG: hypothetical protein QOJ70_1105 [Acidobacteriota bacterium]|jgi:hypothetical protein|nr:hypothetical protein [Acidobacteriota bacterium]
MRKLMRRLLTLVTLILCLVALSIPPAARKAHADAACCDACDAQQSECEQSCIENAPCPGPTCGTVLIRCRQACESRWNSCIASCGSCE